MFNSYKLYSVHIDPDAARPYETAVFVYEGFNWKAFFFGELWALYRKQWILAFVLFCLSVLLAALGEGYGFGQFSIFILQTGLRTMVGFQANDTLRHYYEKRGYIVVDMVAAGTQLEAEQRFYDRYLSRVLAERAPGLAVAGA